ncbi:hypothetical protein DSL72_001746 [Monilinia vaccinii-corymbosi]|uniref:Uncharacterized protein n=1 Tax=Monilinia vaccinii-corymbosi TaxID=61207 RepID=A0A8A3PAP6_9HELO|nr:hypothetical protein DSL72_001746 [Monilinia vaccinii-corymbosi]
MRPTSPLSLVLFLQLSTAFPLPTRVTLQFHECLNSQSCNSVRPVIHTLSMSHSKPSDPLNPHFPAHQNGPVPSFVTPTVSPSLNDKYFAEEGAFDNAPTTPSKDIPADKALAAETPLSSAYLQSLTETSGEDVTRPSMPTSALSTLRKEDARRYWEGEIEGNGLNGEGRRCGSLHAWPGTAVGFRSRLTYLETGRRNDFLVVGIVVVFLMVVCSLEIAERFGKHASRRGEIFLEDDETYAFIAKKSKEFSERHSGCGEQCVVETEHLEYRDDETVVDEDANQDSEPKV